MSCGLDLNKWVGPKEVGWSLSTGLNEIMGLDLVGFDWLVSNGLEVCLPLSI